jgi:hypothetical protein
LAHRVRQEKLAQCRALLGQATRPLARGESMDREAPKVPSGEPGAQCPVCHHGRMQLVQTLYRQRAVWEPRSAHAWTGHLIVEADEADSTRVPDSRPVQPGGAWCIHNRLQGALTKDERRKNRPSPDRAWHVYPLSAPAAEVAPSPVRSKKAPQLQTIAITSAI